jgi:2-dehydro-3-deoxygluconokinase
MGRRRETMAGIATFGEIMLRLSPPGKERLFQSPRLSAVFGGGEANVAVSLAVLGHRSRWISVVPGNEVGEAALGALRRHGVDTSRVRRAGRRMGVYFAETGANERASLVVYDREGSALAEAAAGDIDWSEALSGFEWFHVSGITPAVSASAAGLAMEAVRAARSAGMIVSIDLNYRSKLWRYGRRAPEVMRGLAAHADLLIGNEEDCQKALGVEIEGGGEVTGPLDPAAYERLTVRVMAEFPRAERVAITLRESLSADWNRWSAVLRNKKGFLTGPSYDVRNIVDRIGTGDAFAAGLIHGLANGWEDDRALGFGVAASCLKHSIPGDFNLVTEKEVLALMAGDRSGRVRR